MARVEIGVGRVPVCRWAYDPSVTYYTGNIVLHNDCAWIAKQDGFSGKSPQRGSAYWDVFAAVGEELRAQVEELRRQVESLS